MARQLSDLLQIKSFDLDELSWLPNWVAKERSLFLKDIDEQILTQPRWIVAGNYGESIFTHADTIVWLNYPLRLILYRYFTRTLFRIITKKKVCGENYETFSHSFLSLSPEKNLGIWILKTYKRRRAKYTEWKASVYSGKTWVECKNQRAADEFRRQLEKP